MNFILFLKKIIIICFVNVEIDPRLLWYFFTLFWDVGSM
jgi:hypothetical protein